MKCGSCGTGEGGKPSGCKSNGGCSSGGCNRMNVFDWLSVLPLPSGAKAFPIVEVSFKRGSRKDFYRASASDHFHKGEMIVVEGASGGWDVGEVSLTGELVRLQMKKYGAEDRPDMKRILRVATDEDLHAYREQKDRELDVMAIARGMAREMALDMKIAEVEFQADGKRGTFFYTAESRVDFRELIRRYAIEFRCKVDMRQIGARQESGKVGGIGSCGRELCCATWLTDFKTVTTGAARYQSLSINQTKLSGQCGRLKCCLNYELDTYMDGLKAFPTGADKLDTTSGIAFLQKRDIFRNLMWYSFAGSAKQFPVPPERVREIQVLNKAGQKAEDLGAVEVQTRGARAAAEVGTDEGFVNDVGQMSLRAVEKAGRRARAKAKGGSGRTGGSSAESRGSQPSARSEARGARPQGTLAKPKPSDGGGADTRRPRPQGDGEKPLPNGGAAGEGGPSRRSRGRGRSRKPEGGGGAPNPLP